MKVSAKIQATGLVSSINQLPIDPLLSLVPFRVVGDRILVEALPADPNYARLIVKKEADGLSEEEKEEMKKLVEIAKPVNVQEPYLMGKLMCIPAGEYGVEVPKHFTVGLIVNYWHQQKIDITIEGKNYHMVRVSDVWGIP